MLNLIIRRVLIFLFVGTALVTLEVTTEESMLLSLPSTQDVIDTLEEKEQQQQIIEDEIKQNLKRDQSEDYDTLFDYTVRHTFIIEFTRSEFDGLVQDMQDYMDEFGNYKSNNYRKVNITYIADDEVIEIEDVGIRSKGNIYSRYLPVDSNGNVREIHYMMKFNYTFEHEVGTKEYDDLKTREVFNLEQILFKRNNQNDPSYTNEVFAYESFKKVDVVVPNASFAEVRIVVDGKVENTHLYNIFEHYDEEFIRKNFQETPTKEVGDLYKGQWSATLDPIYDSALYGVRDWRRNYRPLYSKETNKEVYSYGDLVRFSYGINYEDLVERKAFFEENFNIDSFLRAMAMNVLLGNPDDYRGNGNNFYYYIDLDGVLTYVPFDYDNSMGNGWDGLPAFENYTLGNDIYDWGHFEWNYFGIPLWDNLIVYEEYQIQYEDYLMEFITDGTFSEHNYKSIYNYTKTLYGDLFEISYDKEYFINEKIRVVTEDVEYYRNQR